MNEKKILAGYLDDARHAALELSGFLRENIFCLIGKRQDLRLRYENMIQKIEKYEDAFIQHEEESIRRERRLIRQEWRKRGRGAS